MVGEYWPRTLSETLVTVARQYPVVMVTGPRQSGKTTLCRATFPDYSYVSLEPLDTREFAQLDPRGFLSQYSGGVILDEAQRVPQLFSYLQEEVDMDGRPGRFIVSGSENLSLSKTVNQSLAGRTAMLVLLPLSLEERLANEAVEPDLDKVLFEGGYPRPLVTGIPHERWLQDYITTYVQRDVRQLTQVADLSAFTSFVRLCAGRTAQELNLSKLGADAGISHNTAKAWLGVLEASYLAVQVPAWHRNINKRIIKRPKLHMVDTGLTCALLGIRNSDQLATHPLRGAIFESLVATEIHKWHLHRGQVSNLHHYRETRGLEIDLVVPSQNKGVLVECKAGKTVQAEFLKALADFDSNAWERFLIYGGDRAHTLNGIEILPWRELATTDWNDELDSTMARRSAVNSMEA